MVDSTVKSKRIVALVKLVPSHESDQRMAGEIQDEDPHVAVFISKELGLLIGVAAGIREGFQPMAQAVFGTEGAE